MSASIDERIRSVFPDNFSKVRDVYAHLRDQHLSGWNKSSRNLFNPNTAHATLFELEVAYHLNRRCGHLIRLNEKLSGDTDVDVWLPDKRCYVEVASYQENKFTDILFARISKRFPEVSVSLKTNRLKVLENYNKIHEIYECLAPQLAQLKGPISINLAGDTLEFYPGNGTRCVTSDLGEAACLDSLCSLRASYLDKKKKYPPNVPGFHVVNFNYSQTLFNRSPDSCKAELAGFLRSIDTRTAFVLWSQDFDALNIHKVNLLSPDAYLQKLAVDVFGDVFSQVIVPS